MGLSASQARFLQLTARRSNVEYQAQQINFERLQWSDKLEAASQKYNDATSNRTLSFAFNNGSEVQNVDVTYNNYKNFMNQQMEGLTTAQQKMYLVSSTGNKMVVANQEDMETMITQSNGEFTSDDFMIVPDLDDVDAFQEAIRNGICYFATLEESPETSKNVFNTQDWSTIGGGAISDELNVNDDAEAEAEYEQMQTKVQNIDKKLEMQLNKLETERSAIQTEIDSISKVIEDNIEKSFKIFS